MPFWRTHTHAEHAHISCPAILYKCWRIMFILPKSPMFLHNRGVSTSFFQLLSLSITARITLRF